MRHTVVAAISSLSLAAAGLLRRDVLPHDQVVGFPTTVPDTIIGDLYLKFQPYLYVRNGCVPFPAVGVEGNVGGGLAPTGNPSSGCSSSTGQVYARSANANDAFAIMYSWYMPKDSPSTGLGHRHDWEGVVVWLSNSTSSPTLLGAAPSAHGGWDPSTDPETRDGSRVLVEYVSYYPLNHQMVLTGTVGGEQSLVAWEELGTAAQEALTNTDWGDANVPFIDANFERNLGEAAL